MKNRGVDSSRSPFAPVFILAAMLLLANAPRPAATAEICATGMAGTATSCEAALDLARDLARRRSDRTLAADPLRDRAYRLENPGSTQGSQGFAPFAMSGDDNKVNFATSLTQWGSALTAADLESLKQAQTAAGGDAALPKPPNSRAPKFDLLGARPL